MAGVNGARPTNRRARAAAVTLAVVLVFWPGGSAAACEPSPDPDVLETVSSSGVSAVVERRVIAANPAPWGRSVWAVTRIWGEAVVERWEMSDRRWDDCPSAPYATVDSIRYDLPPEHVGWEAAYPKDPVDGLAAASLEGRFGPPRVTDGGRFDTVMAWLRVMPSLVVGPLVIAALILALVVRRRRARDHDYLF